MIWLLAAMLITHKPQRIPAVIMVAGCMVMMRLQVELMEFIGYPHGLIGFMGSYVFYRGLAVYSVCYAVYLILAHYSPGSKGSIFVAASISMFFIAFFMSSVVMVL